MRQLFMAGWLFLALGCPVLAQEVPLKVVGEGAKTIKVDQVVVIKVDRLVISSFPFTVSAPAGAGLYFWQYPKGVEATDKGDALEVTAAPKGNLVISVKCISPNWESKKFLTTFGQTTVAVGEVPPGPTPPGPTPDPPSPAPIPTEGLRVLIVYESAEQAKYTAGQMAAIYGKQVRDYLTAKCAKGTDGTPERRIWDKDVDASGESKLWKDAFARPRKRVPWLVISNGHAGFEGPLPESVTDTVALLKKYGE